MCLTPAVPLPLPLPTPAFRIVPAFAALLTASADETALVAIDIPIGLPSGRPRDDGRRRADEAARAFLGGRRGSSVFSAPCRRTLDATEYRAACASELAARGAQLSQQAFRIIPKIREVDRAILPAHQGPPGRAGAVAVREAHPESVFAALQGCGAAGRGLAHPKRTPAGETVRLELLRPLAGALDLSAIRAGLIAQHRAQAEGGGERSRGPVVGRDDIVDAVACLVAAYRVTAGLALVLPAGPPAFDERGLRMEIVA
ncbi:MAG: DUF429 domain-containing protein [Chloroflexi bacterium]|nr:DUF429 domain-containing protein [Chloroflexota bacterium]